jgi:hypothetical protein
MMLYHDMIVEENGDIAVVVVGVVLMRNYHNAMIHWYETIYMMYMSLS